MFLMLCYVFHSQDASVLHFRVERHVSRWQEVPQLHRIGTHEAALVLHTPLIRIPRAWIAYPMEHHLELQVRSTQMDHLKSCNLWGVLEWMDRLKSHELLDKLERGDWLTNISHSWVTRAYASCPWIMPQEVFPFFKFRSKCLIWCWFF